jgi:hypothetical protein
MVGEKELADWLTELAMRRTAVRDFEDWFVQGSWNAQSWAPRELCAIVYLLELELAEYSNGHSSNSYLRAIAGDLARQLTARSQYIRPVQLATPLAAAELLRNAVVAHPVLAAA